MKSVRSVRISVVYWTEKIVLLGEQAAKSVDWKAKLQVTLV